MSVADANAPYFSRRSKGASLVEVVVAAAIVVLVVLSLVAAYLLHLREGLGVTERVQASLLAEEGMEVMKFLRDEGWTTRIAPLSPGAAYYIATSSGGWQTTTTPSTLLGSFTRTVRTYNVNRDVNGDIVSSGGTPDAGTRKVVVTVTWLSANGTATKTLSTYLTNLFTN